MFVSEKAPACIPAASIPRLPHLPPSPHEQRSETVSKGRHSWWKQTHGIQTEAVQMAIAEERERLHSDPCTAGVLTPLPPPSPPAA